MNSRRIDDHDRNGHLISPLCTYLKRSFNCFSSSPRHIYPTLAEVELFAKAILMGEFIVMNSVYL